MLILIHHIDIRIDNYFLSFQNDDIFGRGVLNPFRFGPSDQSLSMEEGPKKPPPLRYLSALGPNKAYHCTIKS